MWVLRFFLFISKGVLLLTAMTTILWLTAVVILGCVLFQRLSGKVGVPALLFFILLGMFFGTAAGAVEGVHLYEKTLDADSSWLDQPLCRIHTGDRLVILVRRGGQILIPDGDTVLRLGDRLVINDPQSKL